MTDKRKKDERKLSEINEMSEEITRLQEENKRYFENLTGIKELKEENERYRIAMTKVLVDDSINRYQKQLLNEALECSE